MKIFVNDISSPLPYYMMGDSSLTPWRKPLFIPDFDTDFRIIPAATLYISRVGKSIGRQFADRYYCKAAPAFTVRAENLFHSLLAKGLPPTQAVSFDCSAFAGLQIPAPQMASMLADGIAFDNLTSGTKAVLQFDIDSLARDIIPALSAANTLKTGDVILLHDPAQGFHISEGDRINIADAKGDTLHTFTIK